MKTKSKQLKLYFFLFLIFLIGFALRIYYLTPNNIIIGFDQARDLFASSTIWSDRDLKIIGPTAGNNTDLHHGILWLYFILPPIILFGGNPFWVSVWNSLFNVLLVFTLYIFATSLFKSKKSGLISAVLSSVSFYLISYSGWLSNPSPTLVTVPFFFFCLWEYCKGKKWGLLLSFLFLGITIQFELFFIYLIPVILIIWLLLKPKFPDVKTLFTSILLFCLSTSTMILTEIKYNFSGVLAILGAGEGVQKYNDYSYIAAYVNRFFETFSQTILPIKYGFVVGMFILGFLIFELIKNRKQKDQKRSLVFLLVYLLSSSIMLILGYHAAPWFLIGLPPAIILVVSFILSKIDNKFLLISILIFIIVVNLLKIKDSKEPANMLLDPDRSAILQTQLEVVDYTYQSSNAEPFTINTLTNPLYVNATWGWHYDWYGRSKYGFTPSFAGGEQLYPYNTLSNFDDKHPKEKYLYLIIDSSPRIPYVHTLLMKQWADERSTVIDEKDFEGIIVEKRELISKQ